MRAMARNKCFFLYFVPPLPTLAPHREYYYLGSGASGGHCAASHGFSPQTWAHLSEKVPRRDGVQWSDHCPVIAFIGRLIALFAALIALFAAFFALAAAIFAPHCVVCKPTIEKSAEMPNSGIIALIIAFMFLYFRAPRTYFHNREWILDLHCLHGLKYGELFLREHCWVSYVSF